MGIPQEPFDKLVIMANDLATYYFSPVYLVGSALKHKLYNDVDIVVVLSDENFERRYGSVEDFVKERNQANKIIVRRKWAEDCFKRWKDLCDETGLNIDFKTQPRSLSKEHFGKPFLRLDDLDIFN